MADCRKVYIYAPNERGEIPHAHRPLPLRPDAIELRGELAPPDACHCSQCRRQSGHYWASTDLLKSNVTITGEDRITWFQASETVRRGFCSTCGSFLFWEPIGRDKIAVAMGAFDQPTDTRLHMHIFTGDKGDYYDIADGLPQHRS